MQSGKLYNVNKHKLSLTLTHNKCDHQQYRAGPLQFPRMVKRKSTRSKDK